MTVVLRGPAVLRDTLVTDALVVVSGDRIERSGPASDVLPELDAGTRAAAQPLPEGAVLLPGLVDLHCHGAVGHDYADADQDGARAAAAHHLWHGTTSSLASVVSGSRDATTAAIAALRPLVEDGVLTGLHLEGPYLSAARCGAQDPRVLRDPDLDELAGWLAAAGGAVTSLTLAPERPGALEAAAAVRAAGAVPAVGHTDADEPTTSRFLRQAAGDGPVLVTHLFNGMRPWHHRDAGPVAAALAAAARGEAVVELIADGVHLDDATVRTVFDLVGPRHVALVTDAMAATGSADGRYRLGSLDVLVSGGVARLAPTTPDGPPGSIAGGTTRLLDVVRRLVLDVGLPLVDVVTAASGTPAAVLSQRRPSPSVGSLHAGSRADLLVAGPGFEPLAVMSAGHWVGGTPD
ncbi:MAG TPA: amidohydrolase family protein [Actinomycetales bacterium]|nr:amidohydrolase family protein [Actinomycetales bacterium]